MILTAREISKSYTSGDEVIQILSGLNLDVDSKEIIAIMGQSGSGKSTLLHILGALDFPDSGAVTINNIDVNPDNEMSEIRSKHIGFVFQHHHLLPAFTVMENLVIPQLNINKTDEESIRKSTELLESVNLVKIKDRYPNQISGGERQRVALLRALVNSPDLVLADEPTGNLDSGNRDILLNLIQKLKSKYHQSFVLATHDDMVASIADRVLFLRSGKLIQNRD